MSFCYCMGGFRFKRTVLSFYLTGPKRVNRSIQSIFLVYLYGICVVVLHIFCIYAIQSQENGKSFGWKRKIILRMSVRVSPSNAGKMSFFPVKFRLSNRVSALLAAFSVPKSGNIMQAGCVFKLTHRDTSCGRNGMNGWQRINVLAHELSFCYSWRDVWLRYSCPKRYLCANTRFLRMRRWHRVKVSTACRTRN